MTLEQRLWLEVDDIQAAMHQQRAALVSAAADMRRSLADAARAGGSAQFSQHLPGGSHSLVAAQPAALLDGPSRMAADAATRLDHVKSGLLALEEQRQGERTAVARKLAAVSAQVDAAKADVTQAWIHKWKAREQEWQAANDELRQQLHALTAAAGSAAGKQPRGSHVNDASHGTEAFDRTDYERVIDALQTAIAEAQVEKEAAVAAARRETAAALGAAFRQHDVDGHARGSPPPSTVTRNSRGLSTESAPAPSPAPSASLRSSPAGSMRSGSVVGNVVNADLVAGTAEAHSAELARELHSANAALSDARAAIQQ
jgi:hypothetical protein